MEFKVGDRVRILADSCIKGCEADVVEVEQDRVTISCGVFSGCFNKDGLELVNKNKKPPTLDQLEQRIEKLEKEVFKPIVIHDRPKEKSLLTEDERVILSNVDEEFKWIIRNTHQLTITERKPKLEKWGWSVDGGRLADLPFRKLFKFIKFEDDKPYNIEELLKGECEE